MLRAITRLRRCFLPPGLLAVLLYAPFASAADPTPIPPPADMAKQQARTELREYFEFPRRKLEDADMDRLHLPSAVLRATPDYPGVLFTGINAMSGREVCDTYPVILTSSGEKWWIAETGNFGWSWDDVWTSADRSQIWAALTFYCGDPGGEVKLFHSPDGGWTWRVLSTVSLGYYMHYYQSFRMTSGGNATIIASWYREAGVFPCPIHPDAGPDGPHSDCNGLLYFNSEDGGRTWGKANLVHGSYTSIQQRNEAEVQPFMEYEYLDLGDVQRRFPPIPMAIDPNRLPGAQSLPFDEALLARAASVSRYGRPFLEIHREEVPGSVVPHIVDYGNRGAQEGQLIRLPYPGYQWTALSLGSATGILQSKDDESAPIWVVHRVNPEHKWTAGKLPELPREPYAFDSLVETEDDALELHILRLPNANHPDSTGRAIYRSTDEGRTWEHARFEPNVLIPVPEPEYPRVIDREKADDYLPQAMKYAIADLVENNRQRPAPPMKEPGIEELTSPTQSPPDVN